MMMRWRISENNQRKRGLASVRQLFCMLALVFGIFSLAGGTVAHAMEPVQCVELSDTMGSDHASGDNDQVPSDFGKASPHHHGGCHSHQLNEPRTEGISNFTPTSAATFVFSVVDAIISTEPDPALRPPIA